MKRIIFNFFIAGILSLAVACDTETETRDREVINTDTTATAPQVPITGRSDAFKSLFKSEQGVFRGVILGMSYTDVQKKEDTTEVEEKSTDHIDYMVYLPELETAEVRYIFGQTQKLNRIEVNIYPKSKTSQDSLYKELSEYFDAKYGQSADSATGIKKWENKSTDVFVSMEKHDTQKVHDISIVITSLLRQSAVILNEALPEQQ